mgnify:CR=1 FL=1
MSKKPLEDLSLEEIEHIIGKQIPFGKIYDVGYDLIQKYKSRNKPIDMMRLISYGIIIGKQIERHRKA